MRLSLQKLGANFRLASLISCLVLMTSTVTAQVSNYTWVAGTGTYTQLTGAGITTSTTVTTGNADDGALVITLPFTFYYNRIAYTQVTAGTNGWLALGASTSTNAANTDLFTTAAPANAIAGWWGNLNLNTGNSGAFRHGVTAQNVYSVQYDQLSGAASGAASGTLKVRFQINIYGPNSSNPGAIEIIYGAATGAVQTGRTLGIKNVSGTVSYKNGLNGLSNSTATAGTYPANGTKYTFTPPAVAYQSQFISMNTGSTTWCAGELRDVTVTVKNIGTATWTNVAPNVMNIGLKWNEDPDYGSAPNSIPRVSVVSGVPAGAVAPGATVTYTFLNVPGSLVAGTNNLQFDVVKEADCWFGGNANSCGPGNSAFRSPNQTIIARPTAVAGTAINTCSNAAAVNITAGSSATNQSSVTWSSSGTGSFANANSLTTATYTPSAADITAGSVTLTLTAAPNAGCVGNATSNKTLTINPAPTSVAGTNISTCSSAGAVNITAGSSATNQASITWSVTGGTGTLANANSLTNATYNPSAADATAGSRTIVLTAVGLAGCANATSNKTIAIVGAPTAVAGTAVSTCSNSAPVNITAGSSSTFNSGVTWTSSGTGTINNPNSLTTATYEPSAADILAGSVTLTLTATPNAPCVGNAVSNKTLTINNPPTAEAGTDVLTCSTTGAVNITAGSSATNQASITWTTTNGTGSFANATSLTTATYNPSAADITAGTRTLVLTAVGLAGCANVSDTKTINITPAATAVAGTAVVSCANSGPVSITAGASATNNSGVTWTSSGTGTFADANSLTTATYDPSAADILAGSVTLTLTATGNAPCGNTSSNKTFTIRAIPVATGVTICEGTASAALTSSTNCGSTPGSSGVEFPSTGANSGGAGTAWTSPGNIIANDNANATVSGTGTAFSEALIASNFGFSIPASAVIGGVQVSIGRFRSGGFSGEIQDNSVRLLKAGVAVGTNKGATSTNWPGAEAAANYGANNDLWGDSWTAAELNAANFGVALVVDNTSGFSSRTANVDYVTVTITYTIPGTLDWYTVSSGGTSIGSGASFNPVGVANSGLTDTNTPGTTTFYVECSNVAGCRAPVDYVITAAPAAPVSGGDQTVCEDGNPTQTLTATATGGTVSWYSVAIGGVVVTPEQVGAGTSTFYAQSFDGTCSSVTRTPVILTITPAPVAVAADQTVCTDGTTTQTLTATATGGIITWYDAPTGGSVVTTPEQVGVGSSTYFAEASDGTCTSLSRTSVTLTITPELAAPVSGGDQTVCSDGDPEQTITATATGGTITWYDAPTGGNIVSPPSLTGVGSVIYYAEASNGICTSTSRTAVTLTINASPLAPISGGDETACATGDPNQTLIATATSPDPITWYDAPIGGTVVTPALIGIGTATFYAEAANVNCVSPTRTPVTLRINPVLATPGLITGPLDVCPLVNSPTPSVYTIDPVPGATNYSWIVPEGTTIVGGQGTTSLQVTFDNNFNLTNSMFIVTAEATDACTSGQSSIEVLKIVPGIPTLINGPTDACPFIGQPTTATYSIDPVANATSYTWTVAGAATIVSGQGGTSIEVSYLTGFTSGNVRVTANSNCGNRSPRTLSISRLAPAAPVAINGPIDACPFIGTATDVVYSIDPVLNATSYNWALPANVQLVGGQGTTSLTVRFNSGYTTGVIRVRSVSNCATSGYRSLTVAVAAPSIPGAITGPTNACSFIGTANEATYRTNRVANATAYIWTVPAGVTITSHPGGAGVNDTVINVTYTNAFVSGTGISVQAVACIPGDARTLNIVRVLPAAAGIVTGPTNVCAYMVSAGNPSGLPAVYTIRKIANATSYTWGAPAGATITAHPNGPGVNDTTIEVTYSAGFVSGTLTVAANSDCGGGAVRSLAVTRLTPGTPGAITAVNTGACPDRVFTYSLPGLPSNSTSIVWTVPAQGTIISGQGTTSISVSYTAAVVSGTVTATANSNCGSSSTRILKVDLPACTGPRIATRSSKTSPVIEPLRVSVYPNPTVNDFKMKVVSTNTEKITVRILDLQGRQMRSFTVTPFATMNVGAELKAGSYLLEIVQGTQRITEKLVKF